MKNINFPQAIVTAIITIVLGYVTFKIAYEIEMNKVKEAMSGEAASVSIPAPADVPATPENIMLEPAPAQIPETEPAETSR